MKVYIDVLIISNILINTVFVKILAAAVHEKPKRKNILLCMIPAALSSLLIVIKPESYPESLLITVLKLAAVTLIVKIAFRLKTEKRLFIYTSIYIAVNIAFGGLCMIMWELFGAGFIKTGNLTVYFDIPIWLLILCTAAAYGLITMYERIRFTASVGKEKYRALFVFGSFSAEVPAVSDTGNKLIDSFSGEPVVVFSSSRIYYHFDLDDPGNYPTGGFHLIPCTTIAGTSLLPVTLKGKVTIFSDSGLIKELCCAAGITKSSGKDRAIFDPRLLI